MSTDVDFAARIADQLRGSHQPRTWRKVTTVLSAYDVVRLTDGVRTRIAQSFTAAGLKSEPSMMTVDRSARISLSVDSSDIAAAIPNGIRGEVPLGVTFWERAETGWTPTVTPVGSKGLLLIDIDLSLVPSTQTLLECLPSRLDGLKNEALLDVLTPDHRASFKRAMPGMATRQASLFVVTNDENVAPSEKTAVLLSFGLVEFAVGQDWLLIARHPAQTYVSGAPADDIQAATQPVEHYIASLQDCGLAKARTAEAAALAVITQGVDSFGTARTELASYIDSWRTAFAEGSIDKSLLLNLQATLPLVVDALEPLRRPTVVDWLDSEPRARARELTDHVDRNLDALHNLQTTTADALAQADQHQNELYQGTLATLAAVLLAPALVASVFGANQALEDSQVDLIWMFVAMIVAGLLTGVFIRFRNHLHKKHH